MRQEKGLAAGEGAWGAEEGSGSDDEGGLVGGGEHKGGLGLISLLFESAMGELWRGRGTGSDPQGGRGAGDLLGWWAVQLCKFAANLALML